MKLIDLKDKNGTSIQSYIETLMDKMDEASSEATLTIVVAHPPNQLDIISNVQLSVLPDALSQLASQMRSNPKSQTMLSKKQVH